MSSLFETFDLPDIVRKTMNARRLVRGLLLWDTIIDYVEAKTQTKTDDQILNSTGEDDWVKWSLGEILDLLDWLCEEGLKEPEESGLGHEFSLDSLKEESICLHREGSFNLQSSGAVARCLHLACVICLNCILLCLRIDLQSKDLASVIVSGLYVSTGNSEDSKEATKLLYQWTLLPLQVVLSKVERVMDGASSDDYAEANRICKWGGEVCDFLEECRPLFASDDFLILYDIIFRVYRRTALLHRRMGNEKRTTKLLQTLAEMLEDIFLYRRDLMITEWEEGKITYTNPNPVKILDRKVEVCIIQNSDDSEDQLKKICEEREAIKDECGLVSEFVLCNFLGWNTSRYGGHINYIISALGHERFNGARECFEQVVLKDKKLNASFYDFLHGALTDTNLAPFIAHSCLRSPLKWESVCEKQNFFLNAFKALGDRQLTAKYLQSFGSQIALHSIKKLIECIQDAPKLKIRLKEELNLLQLPSPVPVYVHSLNSYLRDPCKSDEHKRDDLPDTLKAYCLLKRSIDIYSDFLHNWTQRSSNEVEWLQLLESQKSAHEMLCFLLMVGTLCYKTLMKGNDSSVGANNSLVQYSKTRVSALKRAFFELSSITLVWVETGRARTLLNQLGPWYNYMKQRDGNPGSLKEELYEFDNNQEVDHSCSM